MAWENIVRQPNYGNAESALVGSILGTQRLGTGFQQLGDMIQKRARNKATRELLMDMDTFDRTKSLPEQQNAIGQLIGNKFTGDAMLSPTEQLGLQKQLLEPSIKQQGFNLDSRKLDLTQQDLLNTKNYRDALLGSKAVTQPKTGQTLGYDPITGQYSKQIFQGINPNVTGGSGGVNLNKLVKVSGRDGSGIEKDKYVPLYIKDDKGNVIINPETETTKAPNLSLQDKDFIDNFGRVGRDLNRMAIATEDPNFEGAVGPFDELYNEYVGKWYKSADHQLKSEIDANSASISAGIVKEFGSNPSNIDLAQVMKQVPESGNTEAIFKDKLARFSAVYSTSQAREFNRIANSNPEAILGLVERMKQDTSLIPVGYQLDDGKDENGVQVRPPKLIVEGN